MTIPAGVSVMPILFVLHHDPAFWEKPNEFYPDHFSQINEQKRPKGVFVPFLNGPRHCPGNFSCTLLFAFFNSLTQIDC